MKKEENSIKEQLITEPEEILQVFTGLETTETKSERTEGRDGK